MRSAFRYLLAILGWGVYLSLLEAHCPKHHVPRPVRQGTLSLKSAGGSLNAELTMRHSVDTSGYNHYCLNYATAQGDVEAPTLRLKQGDHLVLDVKDRIESDDAPEM